MLYSSMDMLMSNESLNAGMNGHLSKPIVMEEVVKTIAGNLQIDRLELRIGELQLHEKNKREKWKKD